MQNSANSTEMIKNTAKRICPIFLTNGKSSTVIRPIDIARKYNIDRPRPVRLQDSDNGILIKKLEFVD